MLVSGQWGEKYEMEGNLCVLERKYIQDESEQQRENKSEYNKFGAGCRCPTWSRWQELSLAGGGDLTSAQGRLSHMPRKPSSSSSPDYSRAPTRLRYSTPVGCPPVNSTLPHPKPLTSQDVPPSAHLPAADGQSPSSALSPVILFLNQPVDSTS